MLVLKSMLTKGADTFGRFADVDGHVFAMLCLFTPDRKEKVGESGKEDLAEAFKKGWLEIETHLKGLLGKELRLSRLLRYSLSLVTIRRPAEASARSSSSLDYLLLFQVHRQRTDYTLDRACAQ